jgi:hypothetical protein
VTRVQFHQPIPWIGIAVLEVETVIDQQARSIPDLGVFGVAGVRMADDGALAQRLSGVPTWITSPSLNGPWSGWNGVFTGLAIVSSWTA